MNLNFCCHESHKKPTSAFWHGLSTLMEKELCELLLGKMEKYYCSIENMRHPRTYILLEIKI